MIDDLTAALLDSDIGDAEVESLALEQQSLLSVRPTSLEVLRAAIPNLDPEPQGWGTPLAGGVGKIKAMDKALADQAVLDGVRRVSPTLLEADWIATRTALFYVTPRLGTVLWWRWRMVRSVTAGRQMWKFSGVTIDKDDGERLELRTSRAAVPLLLAFGERYVSRRPI